MAIATDEVRSIVKHLAEICRDGEEGFREAAEKAHRQDLRTLFFDLSAQRGKFATEMQRLLASIGGVPDNSGTLAGALHRGWLDLKAMVAGSDDAAIIAECERGEDHAKDAYRDALGKDLPTDVREIVERQYQNVLDSHNMVRTLELRTEHA
jgi:uncharacterized protein (TIGR02284 family)